MFPRPNPVAFTLHLENADYAYDHAMALEGRLANDDKSAADLNIMAVAARNEALSYYRYALKELEMICQGPSVAAVEMKLILCRVYQHCAILNTGLKNFHQASVDYQKSINLLKAMPDLNAASDKRDVLKLINIVSDFFPLLEKLANEEGLALLNEKKRAIVLFIQNNHLNPRGEFDDSLLNLYMASNDFVSINEFWYARFSFFVSYGNWAGASSALHMWLLFIEKMPSSDYVHRITYIAHLHLGFLSSNIFFNFEAAKYSNQKRLESVLKLKEFTAQDYGNFQSELAGLYECSDDTRRKLIKFAENLLIKEATNTECISIIHLIFADEKAQMSFWIDLFACMSKLVEYKLINFNKDALVFLVKNLKMFSKASLQLEDARSKRLSVNFTQGSNSTSLLQEVQAATKQNPSSPPRSLNLSLEKSKPKGENGKKPFWSIFKSGSSKQLEQESLKSKKEPTKPPGYLTAR